MWRKTACAAVGLATAIAAAYVVTSTHSEGRLLDLSFMYPQHSAIKGDRLQAPSGPKAGAFAISFNLPEQGTTVVAKNPPAPVMVSAVRYPRDRQPVQSVIPIQQSGAKKPRLPEGCESPFSPVTVPSMAHIAGRCMS